MYRGSFILGIVDYSTCFPTVAAIGSAIAAIAALFVAKSSFNFQKNSLLKKATIEQILKLLYQLQLFKSLSSQAVLDAPDDVISGLKQRILETKENLIILESMISPPASAADITNIRNIVFHLSEYDFFVGKENKQNITISRQLDDAISVLQKIYHAEIK